MTTSDLHSDSGHETANTTPLQSDCDDISLSDLFNKDRGRPWRRVRRIQYEESSPCSDTDSDFQKTPKKRYKPLPLSGSSEDWMRAQKIIVGKAGGKRSFATKDSKSTPRPVRNTRCSNLPDEGATADTGDNAGEGTKSSNAEQNLDQETSETTGMKPVGSLSVTKHGLKKFKRVHKFKCKECDFVGNSHREINNHHKSSHSKCYCNTCGKACNTPSTLSWHMYSHNEDLSYPCEDCEKRFAFSGQLKQHRFKHWTVATFPCSQCEKRFMR